MSTNVFDSFSSPPHLISNTIVLLRDTIWLVVGASFRQSTRPKMWVSSHGTSWVFTLPAYTPFPPHDDGLYPSLLSKVAFCSTVVTLRSVQYFIFFVFFPPYLNTVSTPPFMDHWRIVDSCVFFLFIACLPWVDALGCPHCHAIWDQVPCLLYCCIFPLNFSTHHSLPAISLFFWFPLRRQVSLLGEFRT